MRTRKNRRMSVVLIGLLTLSLIGCSSKEEESTDIFTGDTKEELSYQAYLNAISPQVYTEVGDLDLEPGTYISIIGKEEGTLFWDNVEAGVTQAAEDLNEVLGYSGDDKIKVVYNAPDKEEDIDDQVNILDEELARYPDVVGIASVDETEGMVQFELAALPVIALDSGNTYQGVQCTVETDNVKAAQDGARRLAEEMDDTGEILLLVHDSTSETAKSREEGFLQEIEENHPDLFVVETLYCDDLEDVKRQIVDDETEETPLAETLTLPREEREEIEEEEEEEKKAQVEKMTDEEVISYYLEQYPEIKGIFGTSESAVTLALNALHEDTDREDEPILMGFDIDQDLRDALEQDTISGLIVQNPFGMGYASVIAAARSVLEIGNEAVVDTGYIWVTPENLEEESIQKRLYE